MKRPLCSVLCAVYLLDHDVAEEMVASMLKFYLQQVSELESIRILPPVVPDGEDSSEGNEMSAL